MSDPSRQQAQEEADRLRIFRDQLQILESEGVIALSTEQKDRLHTYISEKLAAYRQKFDIDTTSGEKQLSWGLRIASTLGGLSLCAAIVLLFEHYWGWMSAPVQVLIVVLAPILALLATRFAASREKTLYFAALLSLIAVACFVMNLVVIGEIFNFTSTHGAFLPWGLLALLLAYSYGLRIQLVIGLVALLSWASAQIAYMSGYHWFAFGERPEHFFFAGALLFTLPIYAHHRRNTDFPPVYRMVGMLSFFLSMLVLSASGSLSYLPWPHKTVETFYELAGLLLAAGGVWLGIRHSWVAVVYVSAAFFTLYLYVRLFRWWWDWLPPYAIFAVVGLIAIGVMYLLQRLRSMIVKEAA